MEALFLKDVKAISSAGRRRSNNNKSSPYHDHIISTSSLLHLTTDFVTTTVLHNILHWIYICHPSIHSPKVRCIWHLHDLILCMIYYLNLTFDHAFILLLLLSSSHIDMNLSSFAIGAFLSHAAKAHGDMGGTKHLHYRRLSSAGLLLASSLLLAPTVTAQNEDVPLPTVSFSTRIGNCDVNDFYTQGYEFPNPPSDRCQEQPVNGRTAIVTTPTPQVIPDVFTAGVFGDDSRFTDEFTLEVDGPCSINGLPNPNAVPGQPNQRDQNCGLQGFENLGFQYNNQAYNPDQGVSLSITDVGNDSDAFARTYGICYVPAEDSVPSFSPEVCTIKVTRTQVETELVELCIPPRDFGANCFRDPPETSYLTEAELIAVSDRCSPDGCSYGPCIRQEVCRPAACGPGCGPFGCGLQENPQQPFWGTPLWVPTATCPDVCTGELAEDTENKESFPCEEIRRPIVNPNPPTSIFTIEVEIDTSGNFGDCGDGFCLVGDDSFCDDCANRLFSRNIASPPILVSETLST